MNNFINTISSFFSKKNSFGAPVLPPVNLLSGDWTAYLPSPEPQRWIYDTDECSQLGGFINPLETYFNWLKSTNQLSPAFLDFCTKNGYFDSNGSFSFSERFTAILDGTSINGNMVQNAWACFQRYGVIPRSMLNWTLNEAQQYPNQALMDTSYYNPAAVTQPMIDLGAQFLSYVKFIAWGWVGGVGDGSTDIPVANLATGLQTSPCAIVVPVPNPVTDWNQVNIPYTGGTTLNHAVMLYKVDQTNPYPLYFMDQYAPYQKQLQEGYYVPVAICFYVLMK